MKESHIKSVEAHREFRKCNGVRVCVRVAGKNGEAVVGTVGRSSEVKTLRSLKRVVVLS